MEMREGPQNLIKGRAKLEQAWIRYRLLSRLRSMITNAGN
jgi:hypothetical protein